MKRILNLAQLLKKNSHFLFGPRGTGKSYLIRQDLKSAKVDVIDLLNSRIFLQLQNDPSQLQTLVSSETVVIDEIQRVPELLNEVHRLIEEKHLTFLLTGSSARKLKRDGANMLAGRAYRADLFPLTWCELRAENLFDLEKYLLLGGLPKSYIDGEAFEYLYAYIDIYLKEEISAEALVRSLPNYSRFLEAAAHSHAEMVNFTKVANDAQLSPNTVRDYYQILEDTLLGYIVPPWTKSKKRKAITTSKFYFADLGVVHALKRVEKLERASDLYGKAFEHFITNEIRAYLSYNKKRDALAYWRSKSQFEVDLVVGDSMAIEIKSSTKTSERDHKGLLALAEEKAWDHLLLVSQDPTPKKYPSGIRNLHWEEFLELLWGHKLGLR
jgi:uncharacterized protein